jgi:perosamine synthetase
MSDNTKKFIPLSIPNFEGNERKYVDNAVAEGWVSTGGAYITKMEEQLAKFLHTDNVACVQSGTAALHLSLVDAGIKPGDMVLVPPVTFIAAVNPVKYQFATPLFIDCDDTLTMDPVKLRAFCETECTFSNGALIHKKTNKTVKAVVVVHVFGNMADMESIMDTAKKYNLTVVEDATEALGTRYTEGKYKGKFAGTIGDYGCFSFNGNKIITTGGGGAITAHTSAKVDHLRYLSTQAKDDPHYYIHNEIGYNYRMTNLQAALGVAQMEELEDFLQRKHTNYDQYCELFKNYEYGYLLGFRKGTYSNQWFYSLVLDLDKLHNVELRTVITKLEEKGVQTRAIWGLINEQKPYQGEETYKMEKSVNYAKRVLNIPATTQLTKDDITYAVQCIKEVLDEIAKA